MAILYRKESTNNKGEQFWCDASKWRLGTTAVVPGLPPLARDAVVPARHSQCTE